MLLTDKKHVADISFLDAEGNPIENAILQWKIYKLEWKWWWKKDAWTNAGYIEDIYDKEISSGNIEIKHGKGSFEFEIKYPSWGRYLIVA